MGLIVAKKQKRSSSGFFMGLVIGVAIGAAAVWVLTPQPGEIEATKSVRATKAAATGATGASDATDAAGATDATIGANGATTGSAATIMDLAMAVVERVRGRFGEAVALGREAYEQGQAEVMQRFNQARSAE
jgi:gas vesicle protein